MFFKSNFAHAFFSLKMVSLLLSPLYQLPPIPFKPPPHYFTFFLSKGNYILKGLWNYNTKHVYESQEIQKL